MPQFRFVLPVIDGRRRYGLSPKFGLLDLTASPKVERFFIAGVMQLADIWDLKSRFWGFDALHPHQVPEGKGRASDLQNRC